MDQNKQHPKRRENTMPITAQTTHPGTIEIWEVPLNDHSFIKFFEKLELPSRPIERDPEDSDPTQYYEVVYPDLNIDVYGETHEDLLDAVKSNIRLEWRHFVREEDSNLTWKTRQIKQNYLAAAEEVRVQESPYE
jgi:hypothetical protein